MAILLPSAWPEGAKPCPDCDTGYYLAPFTLCYLCNHPEARPAGLPKRLPPTPEPIVRHFPNTREMLLVAPKPKRRATTKYYGDEIDAAIEAMRKAQ